MGLVTPPASGGIPKCYTWGISELKYKSQLQITKQPDWVKIIWDHLYPWTLACKGKSSLEEKQQQSGLKIFYNFSESMQALNLKN